MKEYTRVAPAPVQNSSSVASLDAFLNGRIADAHSTNDLLRFWWDLKVRAKQLLADLPNDEEIERTAAQLLRDVQRASGQAAA